MRSVFLEDIPKLFSKPSLVKEKKKGFSKFSVMLLKNVPTDLYQEFISWLEEDDQVAFAMVNRIICTQLIKHVRVLWLRGHSENFEESFKSYFSFLQHVFGILEDASRVRGHFQLR